MATMFEVSDLVRQGYTREHAEAFVQLTSNPPPPPPPPVAPIVVSAPATRPPTSEIRAWARGRGLVVSDRGKLSDSVLDAWNSRR